MLEPGLAGELVDAAAGPVPEAGAGAGDVLSFGVAGGVLGGSDCPDGLSLSE